VNIIDKSKFLSLILRHDPSKANIVLNVNGWANVKDILSSVHLAMNELEDIVDNNNKKRFEFNSDKTKIRARQGHSIQVDVELKQQVPPDILYHGTKTNNVNAIKIHGIMKMKRLHVHLSEDEDTALKVARRFNGNPCIIKIDSKRMHDDNYVFFISNNGVWLTDFVPSKYLFSFLFNPAYISDNKTI